MTHATPAGAYAHVPYRNWEAYNGIEFTKKEADEGCTDITAQLIDNNSFINVVFGGGRKKFLPKEKADMANHNQTGERIDGRDLINEWSQKMEKQNKTYKYIWNATDFRNTNMKDYDHVLGKLIKNI